MPDQVDEVRRVFRVVNREGGIQANLFGVLAQQRGCRPRNCVHDLAPQGTAACIVKPPHHYDRVIIICGRLQKSCSSVAPLGSFVTV